MPAGAAALAKAFWPGALTLILKAQPRSGMSLGETKGTVAVRVPDHDGARALLRRTGPLAVSSANVSGQPAALTCDEAREQLGDRVAVYLDGGPVSGGVASTIVDFASSPRDASSASRSRSARAPLSPKEIAPRARPGDRA